MACLQKTFEGSNLPALVNKIMRGQFAPIRGEYSPLFKQLVRDLLQKEPEFRPTASEIQLKRLPELEALFEDLWGQEEALEELESLDSTTVTAAKVRQSRPPRSVLYYLKGYESTISLTPVQLPPRSRILQVSYGFFKMLRCYSSACCMQFTHNISNQSESFSYGKL